MIYYRLEGSGKLNSRLGVAIVLAASLAVVLAAHCKLYSACS